MTSDTPAPTNSLLSCAQPRQAPLARALVSQTKEHSTMVSDNAPVQSGVAPSSRPVSCAQPSQVPQARPLVSQTRGHSTTVSGTASPLARVAPSTDDCDSTLRLWDLSTKSMVPVKAWVPKEPAVRSKAPKQSVLVYSETQSPPLPADLPFIDAVDLTDFSQPVKPVLKPGLLRESCFALSHDKLFIDRVLPAPAVSLVKHSEYPVSYYINLHKLTSAAGSRGQYSWPENTPNCLGACVPLSHTSFQLDAWRKHLVGYTSPELVQHLEFGFPLGLSDRPVLSPALRNHGSSYQYFPWIDRFFADGLLKGGLTGPCGAVPFDTIMVSPLMTAKKKPSSRRAVYDATYGPQSLNNATPPEHYLGENIAYTYPKVEDFQRLVLKCGQGCFLFKRDLARYYLQLPLDPPEYRFTGAVWRSLFFFFVSLMFGLRHSGYQGQKVSDAVAWIHKNLGLEYVPHPGELRVANAHSGRVHSALQVELDPERPLPYNNVNYSDDFGGCEGTLDKATASYKALSDLFTELGLAESVDKACAPSTAMVFLGVHFDTEAMTMSVPQEKLQELRSDLEVWRRKSTAVRRDLQSLLGKLFWVSRVVRHRRPFMGRLLQQLREMRDLPGSKKVPLSVDSRKDVLWWSVYLRHFNGVTAIFNTDDTMMSLDELMFSSFKVFAGDATLWGGGGWYGSEYWSMEFPDFLKSPEIAVHIKEFWVLIASCRLWGDDWAGATIYLFCDNDAVVDCIIHQKPRDPDLLSLLREFLHLVCLKKFIPIARKIDTKSNFLADHISRCFDHDSAVKVFSAAGKPGMVRVKVPHSSFKLSAPW